MGRFYKTASPQMVDFMYKIPEQALLKAIEGTDKQIDTENLYVTESQKLLQKKALSPDEERQVELIKQHQQGIDEVSQLLASSPLAALNDRQKVRALQKKIYEDVTRGELGAQYRNYDIRQKHLEEETKRATDKDGNIRIESVNEAMAAFDAAFARGEIDEQGNVKRPGGTAYDPTTGTYRSYSPEKLVNFYDRKTEFENIAKDWLPSTNTDITKEFVEGNYYVTTQDKDKLLPTDELTWGIYKTAMYDPKFINFYTQQARIKSGGDKKLFNEEMAKLFGEREDPNNPFSKFKMVEVKDAEGKTVMQKVKKMKDGKEVEEEIPVMRMANPGELFMAAQAAAEKKDINEITRSRTIAGTEAYTTGLQQAKEIAVAEAAEKRKEERENQGVWDVATSEVTTNTFGNNKTGKEVVTSFKTREAAIEEKVLNTERNLRTLVESATNINSTQKQAHITKIHDFIKNKNYKGLQTYLASNEIKGLKTSNGQNIGTGIEGLVEEINIERNNIENEKRAYNALYAKVENEIYKDGKTFKQVEAELKAAGKTENDVELKTLYANMNPKINAAIQNATNTTTVTSSNFNNPIIDADTRTKANIALGKLKNQVPALLATGANAMLILDGNSNTTNFNELVKSGVLDFQNMVDEDDNDVHDPNKPFYKVTRVGIVPQNLNNVVYTTKNPMTGVKTKATKNIGKNAIVITLEVNDGGTIKEATVYIDKSQVNNQSVDRAISITKPYDDAKNFVDNAYTTYDPIVKGMSNEEKEKQFVTTPEGYKFYPYSGAEGGTWIGLDSKPLSGDVGTKLYAEKLKNKNK